MIAALLTTACGVYRYPGSIVTQKDDFVWVGENDSVKYELSILSNEEVWFEGTLTRNVSDTVYVRGFEKGSHQLTWLRTEKTDTTHSSDLGQISLWARGRHADTLVMKNDRDSLSFLPIRMEFIKKPKQGT